MQYHADGVAQEILSIWLECPLLKLDGVTHIHKQARLKLRVRLKLSAKHNYSFLLTQHACTSANINWGEDVFPLG